MYSHTHICKCIIISSPAELVSKQNCFIFLLVLQKTACYLLWLLAPVSAEIEKNILYFIVLRNCSGITI